MEWLCHEFIFNKQVAEYSLVVESNFVTVLSVSAVNLLKLPLEVRNNLIEKSNMF